MFMTIHNHKGLKKKNSAYSFYIFVFFKIQNKIEFFKIKTKIDFFFKLK